MTAPLLTQPEVQRLCVDVGMRIREARIASAIAMCESPGFTDGTPAADFSAIGDIDLADDTWGYSYGGFQIRSLRADKGTGRWRDEDRLLDPRFNCRAAREIKRTVGWNAWSTFSTGMYRAYLPGMFPPLPGTYLVKYGDTLSTIAAGVGCSWEELARTNGLHSPYTIYIGQTLTIPDPT